MSATVHTETGAMIADTVRAKDNVRIVLGSGFQLDYVREIANAYAGIGRDVEVVGGDMHAGADFASGVRFLNLRGRDTREKNPVQELLKLARYYGRLLKHVGTSSAAAVYDVSIGRPLLRCLLMYSAFRLFGKKIIYTAHNVLPHDRATLLNRAIYFTIYRALVDEIVVHGKSIRDRLVNEFGVPAERIHVISHGTYHPKLDDSITKESARVSLGISPTAYVGLIFGFQRPYKGTEFALTALVSNHLPKEITVLVRGAATDAAYQIALEDMIDDFSDRMTINAKIATVPENEVETLFKAADVVLLPYLEGSQSGIKYMAYAYGRPVLASQVGSLAEFIEPGVTGETFECQNERDFVFALSRMMQNSELYDESRIRDIAYNEYSFEAAVKQVDGLYARLSGERRPKSPAKGNKP